VVLPHHLLAAELMAGGLRLATSAQGHERVILLYPDHFGVLGRPFGTLTADIDTALGRVPASPAAARLLSVPDLVEEACAAARDHGLRVLLPFVARLLPGVEVLPVAVSLRSRPEDWERMAALLAPLASDRTLILQSTDFSHYLPHPVARLRDQEVLNLLAAGDVAAMAGLVMPDHLDSAGAMAVQMRLQAERFGAAPVVVASANSQELAERFLDSTTSYVVALWTAPEAPAGPPLQPGAAVTLIGGDVFLGRVWPRLLVDELAARRVEEAVLAVTRGRPLVVNLEGVLLPEMPHAPGPLTLVMPRDLALEWLERLNVIGVSLANNHAMDLGAAGLAETRAALAAAGIPHAGPGERLELPGGAVLVALSDIGGMGAPGLRLDTAQLDALVERDAARPVVALVHWGREYDPRPGPREMALAEAMRARGAVAILGGHPHVASPSLLTLGGGETALLPSLGNFLFDQAGPGVSGAVVELWSFPQGTVFLRRLALPNLFELARGR